MMKTKTRTAIWIEWTTPWAFLDFDIPRQTTVRVMTADARLYSTAFETTLPGGHSVQLSDWSEWTPGCMVDLF